MTLRRTARAPASAPPSGVRSDADDPTVVIVSWRDGRGAAVPRAVVDALRIAPDRRLAARDANRLAQALAVEAAREAGLRLLARADRSSARLRERLRAAGHAESAIEAAVVSLLADGWLDDVRLAGAVLSRSLGRRRDRTSIRRAVAACRRAGLDADTISTALRRLGAAVEDL